jgi:hypothetical protein
MRLNDSAADRLNERVHGIVGALLRQSFASNVAVHFNGTATGHDVPRDRNESFIVQECIQPNLRICLRRNHGRIPTAV